MVRQICVRLLIGGVRAVYSGFRVEVQLLARRQDAPLPTVMLWPREARML